MSADEIRRELETARADARRLAEAQQEWRAHVNDLFERARAAGLSAEEIVDSLGLSAQWTAHRQRVTSRAKLLEPPFFFGTP